MSTEPVALDMSLDDVIARGRKSKPAPTEVSKKIQKERASKRFRHTEEPQRRAFLSDRNRTPWDVAPAAVGQRNQRRARVPVEGRLLRVNGLEFSVLQEDLMELFSAVGPVQKCWIDYDRTDRSLGTGGVIFESASDAQKARQLFDGRAIDGGVISIQFDRNRLPVRRVRTR